MARPYMKLRADELQELFEQNTDNAQILSDLEQELQHRNRPKAKALRDKVLVVMSGGASPSLTKKSRSAKSSSKPAPKSTRTTKEKPAKRRHAQKKSASATETDFEVPDEKVYSALQTVEPIGQASGHPPKRCFDPKDPISLDFPAGALLHERYAFALRALINEMKRKGKANRTVGLENGILTDADGSESTYSFEYADAADLFEGAKVTVRIGERELKGNITCIYGGRMLISLEENCGKQIDSCVLVIDNTAMLEVMAERLEKLDENTAFNRSLAEGTVTGKGERHRWTPYPIVNEGGGELNEKQFEAVNMALGNDISYIWGPPGTGKTHTLTVLVQSLLAQDKRILICSNTNQAVDQVLLKLCRTLGPKHPTVDEGKIIRVGRIAQDDLRNDWSEYVTLSGVVERLSQELIMRRERLEREIAPVKTKVSSINRILSQMEQLEGARVGVQKAQDTVESSKANISKLQGELRSAESKVQALLDEQRDRGATGFLGGLFKRSPEAIEKDLNSTRQKVTRIESSLNEADNQLAGLRNQLEDVQNSKKSLESLLAPVKQSQEDLELEKRRLQASIESAVAEIQQITGQLADMEKSTLDGAKVIGATVTKTYLSPKQFSAFDVVIVDEASMVLLPALFYVAGLAAHSTVISGDFRQLAPIVLSNEPDIVEAIGKDVFSATGIAEAVESGADPDRLVMLDIQYRMSDQICEIISEPMYGGRLKTATGRSGRSHDGFSPISQTLTVVDTSSIYPFVCKDIFNSRYNLMHAIAIRNLYLHLHERLSCSQQCNIGVITPYAAQAKLHRKIASAHGLGGSVSAGTVHCFQGDEKDIIIFDVPDSLGEYRAGIFFDAEHPHDNGASMLNVAITRAQNALVVFANLTYLQEKLPDRAMFRDMLHLMQTRGRIIDVQELLDLRPIYSELSRHYENITFEVPPDAGVFRGDDFEKACLAEMAEAKKSITIFSGFITPQRVSAYGDLFRKKIAEGVSIRCVTRSPRTNGSIPEEAGKEALNALEGIGCVVDTRSKIHEKVIIIDEQVVWSGSLNMLSHTGKTDEMMVRLEGGDVALQMAIFMSAQHLSSSETGEGLSVRKENPDCPDCGSRVAHCRGKYGPYWACEECSWRQNTDNPVESSEKANRRKATRQKTKKSGIKCPECGKELLERSSRRGPFLGCSGFPDCRHTQKVK